MSERAAQAVVVHGLRDLLGTSLTAALCTRGFDVSASAPSPESTALALVDLDVPGYTRAIGKAASTGLIVIGLASDEVGAAAAIAAGAAACFSKSEPLRKLSDLMRDAAAGREVMDPRERERLRSMHRATERLRQTWAEGLNQLSQREREVLQLLDEGLRATAIAARLYLSIATVRTHIQNVLNKLGVGSQEKAVSIYRAMVAGRVS